INHSGYENFRAWSAGSQPRGEIHPMTLTTLEHLHIPTNDLYSKSWDEFTTDDAPRFDFIITVCDKAAGEVCPVWPGTPITAHWGVPDPATEG
ncbi:arsenate reductase ArsC, partial [Acinetobacter baumannii]